VLDASGQWAAPSSWRRSTRRTCIASNYLLKQKWGADFVYDEMTLTGDGAAGQKRAKAAKRGGDMLNGMLNFAPARAVLRTFVLPKPGQGPTKEQRETGFYDVGFQGETCDGRTLRAGVKGEKDPRYGSTSR
jgi:hypothetical protein